jgi:hypothetical protein
MQVTINKRRLTVLAAVIFACSLAWLFALPPDLFDGGRLIRPANLYMAAIQILLGVGVQRWTRDRPRYERLRLWVYFYTLVICSVLVADLVAVLVRKF